MASDESRSHPASSIGGRTVQRSEFLNPRKKFKAGYDIAKVRIAGTGYDRATILR